VTRRLLFFLVCFAALASAARATTITGHVVGVADGDTLTMMDADQRQHVIRLDGIDAPERRQAFGSVAKQRLSDLAYRRAAIAECHKVDRYGRNVCRVMVGGVDVCLEQVRSGMAWHFKRYEHEQTEAHRRAYAEAELEARLARAGVWSTPEQVAPWEWRAKRSENR
jgi:endonuclease YncB( thermonuclease family)